jgi:hypothetical protein
LPVAITQPFGLSDIFISSSLALATPPPIVVVAARQVATSTFRMTKPPMFICVLFYPPFTGPAGTDAPTANSRSNNAASGIAKCIHAKPRETASQ